MRILSVVLNSRRNICKSNIIQTPVTLNSLNFVNPEYDKNTPLVIVHGLFGQKQNWNSVGKALHQKLKSPVFAVDVRNHGNSPHSNSMTYTEMAEDLVGFIDNIRDQRGCSKVNLLGHSMGGKIVMRLAIDNKWSERIEKLIVEDVSPKGYSKRHKEFRHMIKAMRNVDVSRSRKEILVDLETVIPELSLRQFILTNLQPSRSDRSKMEWKCNLDTIDNYVEEILGSNLPVGSFRGPTLFVYGEKSGYITDDHKPDIRCRFPQVVFDEIPGAGHWVHAEKPQLFMDSVCKFLNSS